MREAFELPDLGEGIAEGELVEWLVEPGDAVTEDEIIAKVETDKALVDLPSPYEGTVVDRHAAVGDVIPVDTVLVEFDVGDEGGDADTSSEEDGADADPFAPPRVRRLARELDVDLATVDDGGGRIGEADVQSAAGASNEADAEDGEAVDRPEPSDPDRTKTLAAPATRRLAREADIDIEEVPASERRDGHPFVTPADVRSVADGSDDSADDAPASGDRIPYAGIRRTIGERMAESKYTAPHVSHHDEVEVSSLVEMREHLTEPAAEAGVDLTYLPFAVKAVTAALQEVPAINAELDEEAEEIVLHDAYHIGIAVATDAGLMVPVVDHADRKDVLEIAREIAEKAERARGRELDVEELRGSTFTVTNVGAIGGKFVSPIINHPEAAILGLGTIKERPWVADGEVVARPTLPISMTSDHRIVDGREAATFTNVIKRYLREPSRLLLE